MIGREIFIGLFSFFKLDKANARIRNLKRTNDELEEELSQIRQRYRRAQREKDEIEDTTSFSRNR